MLRAEGGDYLLDGIWGSPAHSSHFVAGWAMPRDEFSLAWAIVFEDEKAGKAVKKRSGDGKKFLKR